MQRGEGRGFERSFGVCVGVCTCVGGIWKEERRSMGMDEEQDSDCGHF